MVLLSTRGYEVVGTASNGVEALKQARLLSPDLILMDIEMPVCDGLAATRLIKAEMPQIKIVMLTVSSTDENLFEAIRSGASGYLLKSQSADRFLEMVAQIERGGAALPPEMAARLLEEFARQAQHVEQPIQEPPADLSARQLEVLTMIAQGQTYAQAARALHLSEATVRYHMGQILERLHLRNRAQVIAYAARHGLAYSHPE
jgi:two-component system NarL family response regulator